MLCERSILEAQSATIRENGVRQALVRIQHVLRRHRGNQLRHALHRMQLAPYETAVLSATGLTDPRILSTLDAHLSQRAAEDALQQRRGRARLLLSHIAGRTQRVELLRGWLAWMRFAHGAALERVRLESRQSVGALEGRLQSRHESQRQRALARCERRTQHATLRKGWRAWAGALQRWRSLEKGLRVLRRAAARIGSRRASRAFAKWRVVAWATRDAEEATMAAEEVDARELASKMALTRQVLGRCDRRLRQGRVSRALSQWRSCVLREERARTSLRGMVLAVGRLRQRALRRGFGAWRAGAQGVLLSQRAAEDALQQRRGRARLLLSHIAGRTQRVELLRGWLAWMRFAHGAALERVRLESRQSVGALEGRLQSRHESQRQRALARCERRTQHATLRKGWRAWAGALQRWRSLEKGLRVLRRAAARIGSRRASRAFAKWRVVAWATRDAEEATMAAEEVDARELASKMALTRQVLGRCDRRLRQGRVSRALSQWRSCVLREERARTSLRGMVLAVGRLRQRALRRGFGAWRAGAHTAGRERAREDADEEIYEVQRQALERHDALRREEGMRHALAFLRHVMRRRVGDQIRHAWHRLRRAAAERMLAAARGNIMLHASSGAASGAMRCEQSEREAKLEEYLATSEEAYFRLKVLVCQNQAAMVLYQPMLRCHSIRLFKAFRRWRDVLENAAATAQQLGSACYQELLLMDERLTSREARLTALQTLRGRCSRRARRRAFTQWRSWVQKTSHGCRVILSRWRSTRRRRVQAALVHWRLVCLDARSRLAEANAAVLAERDRAYRSILTQLEISTRAAQQQVLLEQEHALLSRKRRLQQYDLAISFERWKAFSKNALMQQWCLDDDKVEVLE